MISSLLFEFSVSRDSCSNKFNVCALTTNKIIWCSVLLTNNQVLHISAEM